MLVAVDRTASTLPVLVGAGHFAVNLPSARQIEVAERFAGRVTCGHCCSLAGQDPAEARAAVHLHLVNAAERIMEADTGFWQQEGGDLAQLWAAHALSGADGRGTT